MIDPREYDRHSGRLAQQMQRISMVGPRFLNAIRAAEAQGAPGKLIADASTLGEELAGKPGDGALEVYRDLDSNLASTRRFIVYWETSGVAGSGLVTGVAREIQTELQRMKDLVSATPPHVMAEIKRTLTASFGTDEQRYDFRGSNAVIVGVFLVVLCLRYFGLISLSWWIVWPLATGAAVVAAAAISTFIHMRR